MGLAFGKEEITEDVLTMIVRGNEADKIFSEAVLWRSEGKVPVCIENTGREQMVSLYQMKGQPGAVFGRGLCAGRYFIEGETSVCLLDRETVRALFGSDNVLGMKIKWENTEYEIAGILAGNQPLCIVPSEEGTLLTVLLRKRRKRRYLRT